MKKIAILNTTHIGTMLCNMPLIFRVKRRFPSASITTRVQKVSATVNS